jgi:hypothetical protein
MSTTPKRFRLAKSVFGKYSYPELIDFAKKRGLLDKDIRGQLSIRQIIRNKDILICLLADNIPQDEYRLYANGRKVDVDYRKRLEIIEQTQDFAYVKHLLHGVPGQKLRSAATEWQSRYQTDPIKRDQLRNRDLLFSWIAKNVTIDKLGVFLSPADTAARYLDPFLYADPLGLVRDDADPLGLVRDDADPLGWMRDDADPLGWMRDDADPFLYDADTLGLADLPE